MGGKYNFFGFLFFLCFVNVLVAQELPPIKNYSPFDYNADNQNWALSQAPNKYVYVGNNAGLLEFNGEKWRLYRTPNYTSIRSAKAVGDRIYTGCFMDFGYWTRNNLGQLTYTSLTESAKLTLLEDEQFWNILKVENWILFISLNRIYIYDTTDESIRFVEVQVPNAKVFAVGNSVFFQRLNVGLFKIERGEVVLVSDNVNFKNNIIEGIFYKENKQAVVLTEVGNFYFLNLDNSVEQWEIPSQGALNDKRIFSFLQLSNGNLVLGTISNGLYVLDQMGNLVYTFNKTNGINNNTVLSLFEDIDNNLWLGLDNGISIINMKSPFHVFYDYKGTLGVVYAATIFKGYLYLGTNQGVFCKPVAEDKDFEFIETTNGQVWSFDVIDNTLFCGHNLGTYIINENKAKKIAEFPGTWKVKPIKDNPNLLIQGNYFGLSVLEKKEGQWSYRNTVDGFNVSCRFFEFIGGHKIIANHEQNGIYTLTFDENYTKIINEKLDSPNGFGSSVFRFNEKLYFTSSAGIYRYNFKSEKFELDSALTKKLFVKNDTITSVIIPQADKLWAFTKRNIVTLSQGKFDNQPYVTRISMPTLFRKTLGVTGFECVINLDKQEYLIGTSTGYLTLNLDEITEKNPVINITDVQVSDIKSNRQEVRLNGTAEFKNKQNNFQISFSTPNYDQFSESEYQYQLLGFYDDWSEWSRKATVTFSNLPYGEYTFKVRSRIGNVVSDTATYRFSIARPWYLSTTALILYGLLAILLSFTIHQIYKRHYTKQREKQLANANRELKLKELENEQQKMHFENEKLIQDIDSKTRELAISTMSIIKKNEFLNEIKSKLSSSNSEDNIAKVIKIIDKNINNEDDWRFFEEAFNNADKDFMKKLKTQHPELTSNDLRLCAYLRLNLSSKEIAPLLNISPKSVEVKRYRLRKKMNLAHEVSLTDYILEL